MTIRERIMAVYRHQVPDQVPVSIYARYLPRGSTERMVRDWGLGILDYVSLTTLLAPPWHTHAGFVSEVQGAEFDIRFTWENGQKLETRIYRTPLGTLTQRIRQDRPMEVTGRRSSISALGKTQDHAVHRGAYRSPQQ